jgi:hypothetical protein
MAIHYCLDVVEQKLFQKINKQTITMVVYWLAAISLYVVVEGLMVIIDHKQQK